MSEAEMPPSVTSSASGKKNKKKEKAAAVHPVQQVQPQPQKPPSPVTSRFIESEKNENDSIIIETHDSSSMYEDVPLIDATVPDNVPVAPPRHGRNPIAPTLSHTVPPVSNTVKLLREKTPNIAYNKGQVIRASPAPEHSIAASMVEFVQENIPMQQNTPSSALPEKVEWVQFHSISKGCGKKWDVMFLGLSRGFQVWVKYENGDFEEVISERQGPIRSFLILTGSSDREGVEGRIEDTPMVALVDAFSHIPDRQFSTVSLVSLLTKKVIRLPSATTSYEEPVTCLSFSDRYLIVSLSTRIFVYDTVSWLEITSFRIAAPPEGSAAVSSTSGRLLAFADDNLNSEIQSCGGLEPGPEETPATYTSQVFSVAKAFSRTVTSIGESVTGTATKNREMPQGIVTILNLHSILKKEGNSTVAHFVAHYDQLSHLNWSPDGRFILTADVSASTFHLFSLMPHASSSGLAAVQHMYRLHRGNTAAKVVCSSFSSDCRWLAVATNHGTAHVFAFCPYGGKPTMRTHGDTFTNKESRFLRSAGLTESTDNIPYLARSRNHSGQKATNRDHPALKHRLLAKCAGNPRIGPYPPPVLLTVVKKIKNNRISADNLTAWATDMTPVSLPSKRRCMVELPRIGLMFSNRHLASRGSFSLLIARENGTVLEYELRPRITPNKTSEEPPELEVIPSSIWSLQRTKNNPDIPPPLQAGSPLVTFEMQRAVEKDDSEKWIPQVEMVTYSGPARRLWQGPQFAFFEYNEENTELMTPSESRQSLTSVKSIPIVMGDKSIDRDDVAGEATRIECGSWVSQSSLTMMGSDIDDKDLSIKIADAMRESYLDAGNRDRHNSSLDDLCHSPRRAHSGDDELLQFDDI